MNQILAFLFLFFLCNDVKSQETWVKSFKGIKQPATVMQASDGNFFLMGLDSSSGNPDISVIKFNSSGLILWCKKLAGNGDDGINNPALLELNGSIYGFNSTTSISQGIEDILCFKIDQTGNVLLKKTFGGSNRDYFGRAKINLNRNGFILSGNTYSTTFGSNDHFLIKVDTNFNIISSFKYGTVTGETWGNAIECSNGSIVVGGVTNNGPGPWDGNIIYTNSSGIVSWGKYISGSGMDFLETNDHKIISVGGDALDTKLSIVKFDTLGNIIQGNKYANHSWGTDIIKTFDGGYLVSATTLGHSSDGVKYDVLLVKLDVNLNVVWSKIYGKSGSNESTPRAGIIEKNNGGFLMVINSDSWSSSGNEIVLVSTDNNGNTSCGSTNITLPVTSTYIPAIGNSGAGTSLLFTNSTNTLVASDELRSIYNLCDSVLLNPCQALIQNHPTDLLVNLSSTATFNLVFSGTTPFYQWQTNVGFGFQNLTNAGQYSGVNSSTLNISSVSLNNNNQEFRCLISSSVCNDTTNVARLSVVSNNSSNENGNVGVNISTPQRDLHVNSVMRIEPRQTAPTNPAKGDVYFDSIINKLRVFDGTIWQNCW